MQLRLTRFLMTSMNACFEIRLDPVVKDEITEFQLE